MKTLIKERIRKKALMKVGKGGKKCINNYGESKQITLIKVGGWKMALIRCGVVGEEGKEDSTGVEWKK